MNTLVSIITPCYNSANFIKETINSVLAQSLKVGVTNFDKFYSVTSNQFTIANTVAKGN